MGAGFTMAAEGGPVDREVKRSLSKGCLGVEALIPHVTFYIMEKIFVLRVYLSLVPRVPTFF